MSYDKIKAEQQRTMSALKTTIEERDKERAAESKRAEESKVIEGEMRKFLKEVISKRDMHSDMDKSQLLKKGALDYDRMSTQKLISEAKKARKEYDETRTNLMKDLHKENSDLKLENINLKEHKKINEEQLRRQADELRENKKQIISKIEEITKKGKNAAEVKSTIKVETSEAEKKRAANIIIEGDIIAKKTGDKAVQKAISKMHKHNKSSDRKIEINRIATELLKKEPTWQRAKDLFSIIGSTGLSLKKDILAEYEKKIRQTKDDDDTVKKLLNNTTYAFGLLTDLGILIENSFTLHTSLKYYEMTSIGNAVYYRITKEAGTPKEAVPSQMSKVLSVHSSAKHGYGILEIADIMRKYDKRFYNVSEFNKGKLGKVLKTHIEVDGETEERSIEPDIVFDEKVTLKEDGKEKTFIEERYIEYELVTQTTEEYFEKIEKYIMRGTERLFFIFPNGTLKKEFARIIKKYLDSKKKKGIDFSNVQFYLYTSDEFEIMCQEGSDWEETQIYEPVEEVEKDDESFEERTKVSKKDEMTNEAKATRKMMDRSKKPKLPASIE